jgi:hypothetical protein
MTINVPGYTRLLLLTGVLVLIPMQVSNRGMSYDLALANDAGGNGNGKGHGQSRAGGNGGGSGTASAGAGGSAGAASNRGRFNSLNTSLNAFRHAGTKSPVGAMAQYSAALSAFDSVDATDDPTAEELAAILSKVANKDELTPETIDSIHQLLLSKEMITQTTLDEAASLLAPSIDPNAGPNAVATVTPTLAELLAEQASLMQVSEPNQGLGPIY